MGDWQPRSGEILPLPRDDNATIVEMMGAGYVGDVRVSCLKGEASLRSIMELLMLSLEEGSEIKIRVSGPEEESVCQELVELFQTEFDYPPN